MLATQSVTRDTTITTQTLPTSTAVFTSITSHLDDTYSEINTTTTTTTTFEEFSTNEGISCSEKSIGQA